MMPLMHCSFICKIFARLFEDLSALPCHCCVRCRECHSTLLPGSYKLESDSGSLVCKHHLARHALTSQNGRPDLTKKPVEVQSARIGPGSIPHTLPSERDQAETSSLMSQTNDTSTSDSVTTTPVKTNEADSLEKAKQLEDPEEKPCSSSPPNPFDESDGEEEKEEEEDIQTPAKCTANGDLPKTPDSSHQGASRPVPAPRRVTEPTPPPRPAPRVRLPHTSDGLIVGMCLLQKIYTCKNKYELIHPHILIPKSQVNIRNLRLLQNPEKDPNLLEGSWISVKFSFAVLFFHFTYFLHQLVLLLLLPPCLQLVVFCFVFPPVTPSFLCVCLTVQPVHWHP